ncbi:MAG: hypothetical protein D6757_01440 [Alphaproteobacteria bacterium]|nr:MAG: hypothetical protein D6757_01440 [Alphaproteobacteria bacterium]
MTDSGSEVHRFTTKYVPAEDRIQILMELKSGEVQVLWLTRRLLNLLLPRLLHRLEGTPEAVQKPAESRALAVQRFSQQAAVRTIRPQPPVTLDEQTPQRPAAVAAEVDIRTGGGRLFLDFRDAAGRQLPSLPFGEQMLRQWLGVVQAQYRAGGWNETFWPAWMAPAAEETPLRHLN